MIEGFVWYAAYGSNMHAARLRAYLAGGAPAGTERVYPGCRDASEPVRSTAVELPGAVYFATESPVWTGGRGYYDPGAAGVAYGRAHLLRAGQFCDIAAQEMDRPPGTDLDLAAVVAGGRLALGPGIYETLVCAGELDGAPVLTFTAPWSLADVRTRPPSPAYLRHLAAGLDEAGAWDADEIARYLAGLPGAAGHWTERGVRELLGETPAGTETYRPPALRPAPPAVGPAAPAAGTAAPAVRPGSGGPPARPVRR
ncbi:histone deacetylase [Streptomyces sp. NPDC048604]|uniref:histone deacetylase n=1 Tax=Streptomyces sp. NPDC048604 TaxID=3365578 RepID=UPI00371D2C46